MPDNSKFKSKGRKKQTKNQNNNNNNNNKIRNYLCDYHRFRVVCQCPKLFFDELKKKTISI